MGSQRTFSGAGRVTSARRPLVGAVLWGLALSVAIAPTPDAAGDPGGPRVSVMEIPLSIDLDPLFRRAEELLPREVGHWPGWQEQHGVETRYRAWRGPLGMSLMGDVLRVEAHVRYWFQARKRFLGRFDVDVGCGVDEPPRQAVVGLLVHVGWGPDWTVRPGFRVLPTRFIDRCELTAADIDVSPLIDAAFRRRMERALRGALDDLRPRIRQARARAAGYWDALRRPVELAPGLWLSTNPLALALAPARGNGRLLETTLGILLSPRLGDNENPEPSPAGLPPLQTFRPRGAGMGFDIALDLDLDDLGSHLSQMVAQESLEVQGHRIGIRRLDLAGDGSALLLTAMLSGDVRGKIRIWAEPVFDRESQTVELEGLEFIFEPENPEHALTVNLFYQRIGKTLQEAANALLERRVSGLRHKLAAALTPLLPPDLLLDLSQLRLQDLNLSLSASAVRVRGRATGGVVIHAR